MRILLDTQAFLTLYLQGDGDMSAKARRLISNPETERLLSSISVTEIAVKSKLGKLAISEDEVSQAASDLLVNFVPFKVLHALRLFDLPMHHKDPFDRMLIATALVENVPIVTTDRYFKDYKGVSVIW